jgi:hypothetical protein
MDAFFSLFSTRVISHVEGRGGWGGCWSYLKFSPF